jgi:hypothetical protein
VIDNIILEVGTATTSDDCKKKGLARRVSVQWLVIDNIILEVGTATISDDCKKKGLVRRVTLQYIFYKVPRRCARCPDGTSFLFDLSVAILSDPQRIMLA